MPRSYDAAIVTHAVRERGTLAPRLAAEGTRVIELPCVRIEPVSDVRALASAIAPLGARDWLVVTSPAGADALARVDGIPPRVACVGPATAARLREHGIAVAFQPSSATGTALARELPAAQNAVLARSDRALPDVPRILRSRGFTVTEVVAYRTLVEVAGDVRAAREALASSAAVAIHLASPSALDGLLSAFDSALLVRATFVARGPTSAAAVRARLPDARIEIGEEVGHVADG